MSDNLSDLKQMKIWVCWNYVEKGGRRTKVPCSAFGRATGTSSKYSGTWVTFSEARKAACEKNYSGVGFVIPEGWFFLDIDHKPLSDPYVQAMLNRFGSYTERSVSGEGIHIYGRCDFTKVPTVRDKNGKLKLDSRYYLKNPHNDTELYIGGLTNRFAVFTEDVIQDEPMRDCTEAVLQTLEKEMCKELQPAQKNKPSQISSYLSDNEVLQKASCAKNGAKFSALWNGDFDKSHSEADLALCSMLAFWCGGDSAQIDRLFRQSALYRQKWERQDYREETIRKAINGCPRAAAVSAPLDRTHFAKPSCNAASDRGSDGTAQIEQSLRELLAQQRYPQTDIGAGRLFADCFKDSARYVPERKCWFCYSDGVWSEDIGNLLVMEKLKELADALMHYALTIEDEHDRKEYIRFCTRWQARRNREVFLKDAQGVHPISASDFDGDPYVFNCKNGTLRLDTMTFSLHDPGDFLTKISDVTYNPDARCERFEQFVGEITEDGEKAKFLQKALGYGLSGDTRFECMFIMHGATARNGKGTLCESVLKVLGKYGCTARPETLSVKINSNSTAPSEDIARLAGIRFVNISEPGKGLVLNAAQVKTMTGNDTINARFLRENSFDYKPQFKLYINTNYLPTVTDMTLFSGGRVMIIPFDRHFDEGEQDRTLKQEFAKPENQSAILNWLIEGWRLLQKEGLQPPEAVQKATESYRDESDKIKCFAEDCLAQDDTQEVRTSSVYQRYKDWCYDSGQHCENMRNFNQALRTFAEVKRKRPKNGGATSTFLIGYRLITDFELSD